MTTVFKLVKSIFLICLTSLFLILLLWSRRGKYASPSISAVSHLREYTTGQNEKGGPLFRIEMQEELSQSIAGNPFKPLPNYKNPCWKSALNSSMLRGLYQDNMYGIDRCSDGAPHLDHCKSDFLKVKRHYKRKLDKATRTASRASFTSSGSSISRLRCLPYVYLAGVTKSGTSDLFDKLIKHPQVLPPSMKEPMYFNKLRLERDPYASFSHYVDLFDLAAHHIDESVADTSYHKKITIDGSPNYLWDYSRWNLIPDNKDLSKPIISLADTMYSVNHRAKYIFLLREPVERFYSDYKRWTVLQSTSFSDAAEKSVQLFNDCGQSFSQGACAITCWNFTNTKQESRLWQTFVPSLYSIHIEGFMKVVPRENILIIKSEDYFTNRISTLESITQFLGLDPYPKKLMENLHGSDILNKSPNRSPIEVDTRRKLQDFFQPFNQHLSQLLSDKSFLWENNDIGM